MRKAQSYGQKTIAILNTENSSIGRIADYILPIMVGPEIGVASTKAFLGQLMVIAALGLDIGMKKGNINQNRFETLTTELSQVPNLITEVLSQSEDIKNVASQIKDFNSILFIGRGNF